MEETNVTSSNNLGRKKRKKHKKRVDWEGNQVLIRDAFLKLVKKHSRMPSSYEIAKITGLSASGIQKHFKELTFEPMEHQARALTDDVILSIAHSAKKGNSQAQKLWMQVMEGWSETLNQNVTTQTWKDAMREVEQKMKEDNLLISDTDEEDTSEEGEVPTSKNGE